MRFKKTIAALALMGLSSVASADGVWNFLFSTVPLWNVVIRTPNDACAYSLRYDWGDFHAMNRKGAPSVERICRQHGHIGGISRPMPHEPLNISWKDADGTLHSVSLDMRHILKDADVYGGRLEIHIVRDHVEVWLGEPDKSKNPGGTYWPRKPVELRYSSAP